MSIEEAALDNIMCTGTSDDDDMNQKLDDITVVNILLDLGPSCTTNAATFRDALRLATQKLPSGRLGSSSSSVSGGGGAITLKEEEIARLIYFFADVGARKRNEDDNNSSSSRSSRRRGKGSSRTSSSSSPHWNIDVVSQVLTEDIISPSSLDWSLVARSFDFAEFEIRDTKHLEQLLKLYGKASGGKVLPVDQIVRAYWMNKEGQLTLLRSLLLVPSSVYKFPLTEDEALDAAATTLVVASPDTTGTAMSQTFG